MNCEQCDAELRHRSVRVDLGRGGVHTFCCDACKHRWCDSLLAEWARTLNSIYVRGRGLSRDMARLALRLRTNPQP